MQRVTQQIVSNLRLVPPAPWQPRPVRCNCFRRGAVRVRASLSLSGASEGADDSAAVDYAPKSRKQLWMAAIKPPMYSVGIVPVLVSSGSRSHPWPPNQLYGAAAKAALEPAPQCDGCSRFSAVVQLIILDLILHAALSGIRCPS